MIYLIDKQNILKNKPKNVRHGLKKLREKYPPNKVKGGFELPS